jgi:hypothetical protein
MNCSHDISYSTLGDNLKQDSLQPSNMLIVKVSDDGVKRSESLGLQSLAIIGTLKTRKHNVSETGSDSVLR